MRIVARYSFSRDDSCHKMGLRHPAYILMEHLQRLAPGEAVEAATDDADWALTIETIAKAAGFKVEKRAEGPVAVLLIQKIL
ncbi:MULTISPECIES: hypothetical protein [Pyrobaculum]|uniref:Sulfurtransferase TusA family protein n=3 Tax=Pyrobaculum TaxID=2276 RepID=A4WJB5_PYRAR|nr:hypothetical protein [Pyrobaculum arsenaticum]ABP50482.1 conserved hypothetical protein [Pyrobaculum arsenaticum DSM 13514]AFA39476.1 hypothetical protein Pogu_1449 [Pyrobaculum oguniense TE7]MCY0890475.1 hypothetical protein [Pyrobaculum arsenaticum]NYR14577.1 hypothetical protein [Pyrobaculum arsenaticum]